MKTTLTQFLSPASMPTSETEKLWLYNGLDSCVTFEVLDALLPQLDNLTSATYAFSRALQAPVLEMRIRGVKVDLAKRDQVVNELRAQVDRLSIQLNRILNEGLGCTINWRSPHQLKALFYDSLKLPPISRRGKITVDREALERLADHFLAEPIVNHLLLLRDLAKKIGTLETEVDPDGRMRTSYNIAGTSTGRFSSSLSDFGTGGNLQNWEKWLREIFIADEGMKFAEIDLEQAESRLVGAIIWNLFRDGRYLDACESTNLHVYVSKLTNPELPWTGNFAQDREIADQIFYRHHSYYHVNKVLGHGTNYGGTPPTMNKHTKIPTSMITAFQNRYFSVFPGIPQWHEHKREELRSTGFLVSLTGRRRWFFGRRDAAETQREAIAYDPQGSVADILNTGMLHVWRANIVQLLLQTHDSILIQYPEPLEDEIVPKIQEIIKVPFDLNHGRKFLIPSEAKVGWNWNDYCCGDKSKCPNCHGRQNLNGLKKFRGHDERTRIMERDSGSPREATR